jgi:hypothetical protein
MSLTVQGQISKKKLLKEVNDVVPRPELWLDLPNDRLGGRTPRAMIDGSDDERRLIHDLVEAVKHGMTT